MAVPLARPAWVSTAPRWVRPSPDVLHGIGESPVEGDRRVGVELSQRDVLGLEGIGPSEQDGGLPGGVLQDAVPEQPDPQPRTYYWSCRSASFLVIAPHRAAWYRGQSTWERSSAGARI